MRLRTEASVPQADYTVNGTEFIGALLDSGAIKPEEAEEVARAWHVEVERIEYMNGQFTRGGIDWDELEFQVRITAYTFSSIVENRGAVDHEVLLDSTEEELRAFRKQYLTRIKKLHRTMLERERAHGRLYMEEDTAWAVARAKCERECYKFWQTKMLLGEI